MSENKSRKDTMDYLEDLVDKHTMSGVLCMLSEICSLKEQHLESNWQDHATAKKWRKLELQLDRLHINTDL